MKSNYKIGDGVFYIQWGIFPVIRYGEISSVISKNIIYYEIKGSPDIHLIVGKDIKDLKSEAVALFDRGVLFSEDELKEIYETELERKNQESRMDTFPRLGEGIEIPW